MKKRIFAVVMAAVMTLSMVACGEQTGNDVTPTTAPTTAPTQAPVVDPEPTTAPAVATEATIDFEDGNYGFVMMRTKPRKADISNLSLVDYNGSKAVFVENQGGAEMHIGIDVDAILGDKVTEVKKITMVVGETHPDGKFAAMSGYLAAFVGADLTETKLETWAVYMKNKNPKVVTFNLPEGTSFTAGNDNYITLVKDDDAGAALGSIYIDDICFYDAAGNLLKGDTTVVMEAPKDFLAVVEEEPAANVVKVAGDAAYAGDWCQSAVVPADVLAQFAGQDVTVKVKFELTGDKDYYIWAPVYANAEGNWEKFSTQVILPAEAEGKYRAQTDGTIAIDDRSITELTFTMPAALVDTLIATGDGTFFGMVYGVVAYEIELSSEAGAKMKETVAGDASYAGDWKQSAVVPNDVLAKFAGKDATVTVKFELTNDKDYYIWAPVYVSAEGNWEKFSTQVILPAEAEGKYRAQTDGTIAIDDRSITELTFTLPAALVDTLIATGDGNFFGMVYGVVAYEVVLEAEGGTPTIKEKVTGDASYVGDWKQSAVVPNDVLAKFAGKDTTVTVKFELTNDKDYYIWAPVYVSAEGNWEKFSTQVILPAEAEGKYRAQTDGTIAIDDRSITEFTFTMPAALVDTLIATGDGSFFGMVYGVVAYEIVLEGASVSNAPAVEEPKEEAVTPMNDTIEGTVIHTGSITFADSAWWTQNEMKYADIFGDLDPATVGGIKFTSDTNFVIGYSNSVTEGWDQFDSSNTYVVKNIILDKPEGESVCIICLSKGDGVEYTITWEVYEKAAEPSNPLTDTIEGTVIHTGSLTMADSAWWTQKDMKYADLLGDLDPATVAGIKFTADTTFVLGYSNADTGAWDQYQDAKSSDVYVVKNMVLEKAEGESLCIICLSKGDGVEYTINWEVYGKDGDAAEEPAAENLVINFADLTAGGYGYNAKVNDGAVDVTIASQYQEIQYILPEAVDLAAYKTLIVDVTSNAQLDIKLVDPNAEINEYSQKAPFRDNYTAEGQAITEPVYIDLAEYADKDLSQINFMAMGNDVAFTIKSITFVK